MEFEEMKKKNEHLLYIYKQETKVIVQKDGYRQSKTIFSPNAYRKYAN